MNIMRFPEWYLPVSKLVFFQRVYLRIVLILF